MEIGGAALLGTNEYSLLVLISKIVVIMRA